ncbi:hypothetical protein BV898_12999 [Hypsibius exemplaris]|uniref:P-type domain-containing protein n=1 Tax=Hypsibius exemplaris TaxID=2072580 RepID=A0A1W0WC63_HYPEX|nr:hypothetical protein BV898_12999 [Hypsibius exemplaris]
MTYSHQAVGLLVVNLLQCWTSSAIPSKEERRARISAAGDCAKDCLAETRGPCESRGCCFETDPVKGTRSYYSDQTEEGAGNCPSFTTTAPPTTPTTTTSTTT